MKVEQRGPETSSYAEFLANWTSTYCDTLPVERMPDGSLRFVSNEELDEKPNPQLDQELVIRPDSITCRCGQNLWRADWGNGPITTLGHLWTTLYRHQMQDGCR